MGISPWALAWFSGEGGWKGALGLLAGRPRCWASRGRSGRTEPETGASQRRRSDALVSFVNQGTMLWLQRSRTPADGGEGAIGR